MRSYDFARLWRSTIGFDRLLDLAEAAQRAGEDKTEKVEREFLWHGVSTRTFKRQFNLADYVQVKSAAFDKGLLKIELIREIPEAMKPCRIVINGAVGGNVQEIEAKAA